MQTALEITESDAPVPVGAWRSGQWLVHELASATSTNWVAASLPAWQAVRAEVQTAGRGRFQRSWISNRGGLWLSAVVPMNPSSASGKLLALGSGLAVCEALQLFGAGGLRLRWPNDVLVGNRKLAGILIDQFVAGLAVVGFGINVTNRPAEHDPALLGQVTNLQELVSRPPSLRRLTEKVLERLASVWDRLNGDPGQIVSDINAHWQLPRRVQLDLDGQVVAGLFEGIDTDGCLRLAMADGTVTHFEPHQVRLLRDLS